MCGLNTITLLRKISPIHHQFRPVFLSTCPLHVTFVSVLKPVTPNAFKYLLIASLFGTSASHFVETDDSSSSNSVIGNLYLMPKV